MGAKAVGKSIALDAEAAENLQMEDFDGIRLAHRPDKARLIDLWLRLSADGHSADARYTLGPHASETAAGFIEGWVCGEQPAWVAVVGGEIVGFIVTKRAAPHTVLNLPETVVITDAYVLDEYRRQGMGRRLFAAVRDHALSEGVEALEVGTLASDHRAVSFWRSVGFGDWRVTLHLGLD